MIRSCKAAITCWCCLTSELCWSKCDEESGLDVFSLYQSFLKWQKMEDSQKYIEKEISLSGLHFKISPWEESYFAQKKMLDGEFPSKNAFYFFVNNIQLQSIWSSRILALKDDHISHLHIFFHCERLLPFPQPPISIHAHSQYFRFSYSSPLTCTFFTPSLSHWEELATPNPWPSAVSHILIWCFKWPLLTSQTECSCVSSPQLETRSRTRMVAELPLDSKRETIQDRNFPDLSQNCIVRETWFENMVLKQKFGMEMWK